jgi:hypothetical protein
MTFGCETLALRLGVMGRTPNTDTIAKTGILFTATVPTQLALLAGPHS